MATEKRNAIVVAYVDPFANWSPEMRKQKAIERVNEMLVDRKLVVGVDPGHAFHASHDDVIDRLSKQATETLGTPYTVLIERNVCRRDYEMVVRCDSCKRYSLDEFTDDDLEQESDYTGHVVSGITDSIRTRRIQYANESAVCMCVDGMTVQGCLDRLIARQRVEVLGDWARAHLTPRQREAASEAWSASLRTKQAEAREKERCQVLVDIQDEP